MTGLAVFTQMYYDHDFSERIICGGIELKI